MDAATSQCRLSGKTRDFIGRRHKLLIDGQWVDARSGKTFAVFDPSNGQQIAQVAEGGAEDIAAAVIAARAAFEVRAVADDEAGRARQAGLESRMRAQSTSRSVASCCAT